MHKFLQIALLILRTPRSSRLVQRSAGVQGEL
jgi:hypothetical protein